MFWNSVDPRLTGPRGRWSITTRLTLSYALVAFAMLAMATAIAYWSMLGNIASADRKFVDQKIQVLRAILADRGGDPILLRQEVEWEQVSTAKSQYYAYYSRVADASGQLLMETPGIRTALAGATLPPPTEEAAITYRRWDSVNGHAYLLASAWGRTKPPSKSKPIIHVALDVTVEQAVINQFQHQMAMVLVIGLIASAAIGSVVARREMRPLAAIARAAEGVTASRLHERIDSSDWPRELAALAGAFDHMLARLEESFDRLSRFSGDLAHELHTPLNNLMGEAEVTLSRTRTPAEYRQVLESSLEEYQRLSQMIEKMLFLARADNTRQSVQGIWMDAGQVVRAVCEFHDAVAADRGVELSCEGDARLWADLGMFQRALSNLLANALLYTPTGGRVTVRLETAADGSVQVVVIDNGCGIAAADLPRVFDRFFRGDSARAANPNGVGLGLAMVHSIMVLHGGEAHIRSTPGEGTAVTLHFPAHRAEPATQPQAGAAPTPHPKITRL